jgi:hypothetical protein
MKGVFRSGRETIDTICAEPFDHLATVFGVVLNWRAAAAQPDLLLRPAALSSEKSKPSRRLDRGGE